MKPSTATMILTRKCVHTCENCLIHRKSSVDLPPEKWVSIGKKLHDKWNIHINMYGGEPLCYEGFEDIIKGYSEYGINYSANTCSRPLSKERAVGLINLGLTNWTSSVDSFQDSRSLDGIRALELFKVVKDLMIELVIFPGKVQNAIEVIDFAIEKKYWVSVSALSYGINSNYDSFPQAKPIWTFKDIKLIKVLVDKLRNYKYNHCPNDYLDTLCTIDFLYQKESKCNGAPIVFNPDHDGSMRLCRDIAGNLVRKWGMEEAIEHYDNFCKDWVKDYESFCECCNWGCPYFAKDREDIIKHV